MAHVPAESWAKVTGADVVGGHRACVVMLAVLAGNTLMGDLMAATGYGRSNVNRGVHELRRLGLVDFVDYAHGTLHPTVRLVA